MAKLRSRAKSEFRRVAGNSVKPVMKNALNALYEELDFKNGSLLSATEKPTSSIKHDEWLEKGEWLAAAKRAGAEKLFFVENNPVVVFAECGSDDAEKVRIFNRIWSLARPRLLFLVSPGEISVMDLAQEPLCITKTEQNSSKQSELKTLKKLHDIANIAQELQQFHRDNIESGKLFGDSRFGDLKNRADKALIRDLKAVRRELIQVGLSGHKVKFAHALIGRSIFIRYLEDRGILTKDYYLKVARQVAGWTELLNQSTLSFGFNLSESQTFYPRVLQNKDFAYALFKMLSKDFNGDMFPDVNDEELNVTQEHLQLIQNLFYGDVGVQKRLFFYSYRFDIVPLDLISSIYEVFYHSSSDNDDEKSKARQDGAYYTPSVLAEFVLSRVLTATELRKKPRVLDPACGSGIFLVESFRRIVRYEWHRNKERLDFDDLKHILRSQIAGIEVNEEAARITAFSLYLALLHYVDPPAITEQVKQGNTLPNLLVSEGKFKNHFHCIWVGNAFDTTQIERSTLLSERFGKGCADIIVGNPPWGAPGNKADDIVKAREQVMLEWCRDNKKPIGNKENSQAFLWRALDFLKNHGKAGMLVSAGVLFKNSETTQAFREQWIENVRLEEVFNFTHVRDYFFKGAISPFIVLSFIKAKQDGFAVKYWSAKQVLALKETQAVILSKYDLHIIKNENLSSNKLWKCLWFGRFADAQFIKWLQSKKQLQYYADCDNSGRGYELASKAFEASKLNKFDSLMELESRYIDPVFTTPPERVHRFGAMNAYSGLRVLINEGISENSEPKGIIISQYFDKPFCFYRSLYGIKLLVQEEWCHKTLLGILWSSLSRYYFFMTSTNWGVWHHKLLLDELMGLPVILEKQNPATKNLIAIVEKLRNLKQKPDIFNPGGLSETEIEKCRRRLECELDETVFKLYGLTEEQKDLIRDHSEVTLPFFYNPFKSDGSIPAEQDDGTSWIDNYARIFAKRWNAYLGANEEMRAEVHLGAHGNVVAIEFFPADKKDSWNLKPKRESWEYVLEQIGKALPQPMGSSQIVLDGVIHVVSDRSIIIIKRNEKRFWTRSLAREDANVTLCKRMLEDDATERVRN